MIVMMMDATVLVRFARRVGKIQLGSRTGGVRVMDATA